MGAVDRNRKSGKPVEKAEFENKVAHKTRDRFVNYLKYTRAIPVVEHRDGPDGTETIYLFDVIRDSAVRIVLQVTLEVHHLRTKI